MTSTHTRRFVATLGAALAVATFSIEPAFAVTGGVIVSAQNDCSVGPTNDNSLSSRQTAYVWLVNTQAQSVRGYTYEVTGTNNSFDSGILKIRFNQCRKVNTGDFVAKFTTPSEAGDTR